MKPKILIAESGSHYKIMEQLFHLLAEHCILEFYIINPNDQKKLSMFPSMHKVRVMTERFRGFLFFTGLLFKGWRYKYINISTGPEGNHISDFLNVFSFFFCCLLFRKKIILTIRNISCYFPEPFCLYSFIRNFAIHLISKFTFESETMKNIFFKKLNRNNADLAVSYDRYPDTILHIRGKKKVKILKNSIRIGLLGSVCEKRRNYDTVFHALKFASKKVRQKIKILVLGACQNGAKNSVIKKLKSVVNVNVKKTLLCEKEFAFLGTDCDVLLAPLSNRSAYGTLKGSGSIGDAVYLKKRLILPEFVDPYKEFRAFCIYYNSALELSRILTNIVLKRNNKIEKKIFFKYNSHIVYKSLLKNLVLCSRTNT